MKSSCNSSGRSKRKLDRGVAIARIMAGILCLSCQNISLQRTASRMGVRRSRNWAWVSQTTSSSIFSYAFQLNHNYHSHSQSFMQGRNRALSNNKDFFFRATDTNFLSISSTSRFGKSVLYNTSLSYSTKDSSERTPSYNHNSHNARTFVLRFEGKPITKRINLGTFNNDDKVSHGIGLILYNADGSKIWSKFSQISTKLSLLQGVEPTNNNNYDEMTGSRYCALLYGLNKINSSVSSKDEQVNIVIQSSDKALVNKLEAYSSTTHYDEQENNRDMDINRESQLVQKIIGSSKTFSSFQIVYISPDRNQEVIALALNEKLPSPNSKNNLNNSSGSNTDVRTGKSRSKSKVYNVDIGIEIPSHTRTLQPIDPRQTYILKYDGGARGNPGIAGAGAVLYSSSLNPQSSSIAWSGSLFLGNKYTNNEAEYTALIMGLKTSLELGIRKIRVLGDSDLVCKQMNGEWRCKKDSLKKFFFVALKLKREFDSFQIQHIFREENEEADQLANRAMDHQSTDLL